MFGSCIECMNAKRFYLLPISRALRTLSLLSLIKIFDHLPALYQPKLNFLVALRDARYTARRLIIKLAKSVNKWAASDTMAKL